MPLFRIHEVFPDGSLHDTGKTIECPNTDAYGSYSKEIVRALFDVYGFKNNYDSYYKPRSSDHSQTIYIAYTYVGEGPKVTWVLVKEENETKENENG